VSLPLRIYEYQARDSSKGLWRRRRRRGSSHCLRRRPLFLSLTGHAIISLKSQRSISIGDLYRTIALIVDDHLGGPRPLFDLIEVITMGHGKVISMSSFFSCLRFYGDPSVKTFLLTLRCRGIIEKKRPHHLPDNRFSQTNPYLNPPRAPSLREICLLLTESIEVRCFLELTVVQ